MIVNLDALAGNSNQQIIDTESFEIFANEIEELRQVGIINIISPASPQRCSQFLPANYLFLRMLNNEA
ncbi:hypothetical protein RZL42_001878 [Klebsiella michiganensis]|nr:hypothetical protein [Klebsiella michiganensis]